MVTHPIGNYNKSIIRIFILGNICKRNICIFINNIAHHSDFCPIGIYFHILHIFSSPRPFYFSNMLYTCATSISHTIS